MDSLKKSDHVELKEKESAIEAAIQRVVKEELKKEDRLDMEVKNLMEAYSSQIEKGEVDSRRAFGMIKAKLAKEKGIIL